MISLLLIVDNQSQGDWLSRFFNNIGYRAVCAETVEEALKEIDHEPFDAVLVGKENLISEIKKKEKHPPIIVADELNAGSGLSNLKSLATKVEKTIVSANLYREFLEMSDKAIEDNSWGGIIGCDPRMKRVLHQLSSVSRTDLAVMIRGESGTGKEIAARGIHSMGNRKERPFVEMRCRSFPAESQGMWNNVEQGTLFLDEVGELSLDAQKAVLKRLEEGQTGCRIICSTGQNIEKMVQEKRFLEDLYYRLNVIPVTIPPLRERTGDIPLLLYHFIRKITESRKMRPLRVDPDLFLSLMSYNWPGNVRELENVVQRGVLVSHGNSLTMESFSFMPFGHEGQNNHEELQKHLDDAEQEMIRRMLHGTNGNISKTSKELGISRDTLYRKLKKYGIRPLA